MSFHSYKKCHSERGRQSPWPNQTTFNLFIFHHQRKKTIWFSDLTAMLASNTTAYTRKKVDKRHRFAGLSHLHFGAALPAFLISIPLSILIFFTEFISCFSVPLS